MIKCKHYITAKITKVSFPEEKKGCLDAQEFSVACERIQRNKRIQLNKMLF